MRRVLVLALLALTLPMASLASTIKLLNKGGTLTLLPSGIVSKGSELTYYNGITPPPGHSLGSLSFTTGMLTSGGIGAGQNATFSSVGSSFNVTGNGTYGAPKGTIFNGSFTGTINWTFISQKGQNLEFMLTGNIKGKDGAGNVVFGTTTQTIWTTVDQLKRGIGHFQGSSTTYLNVPEPGTLGLLGTGLVGIAGMVRRRLAA